MSQHVIPTDDTIAHEPSDWCPCGPQRDYRRREDGTTGWVVTHHRLGGRDETEKDTEE